LFFVLFLMFCIRDLHNQQKKKNPTQAIGTLCRYSQAHPPAIQGSPGAGAKGLCLDLNSFLHLTSCRCFPGTRLCAMFVAFMDKRKEPLHLLLAGSAVAQDIGVVTLRMS
jgi:hypothetical protein